MDILVKSAAPLPKKVAVRSEGYNVDINDLQTCAMARTAWAEKQAIQ